jgi:DNA-binding MarR family transcriptional regulator
VVTAEFCENAAVTPLKDEIHQRKDFASPAEEALLNLMRTAFFVDQQHGHFFKRWDLTPIQYNALRILRGAAPAFLPCHAIGERLVTAVPDVTRLLDRLEAKDLVQRERDQQDRRMVRVTITAKGLELLASIDQPIDDWIGQVFGELDKTELRTLSTLLEKTRDSLRRLAT